MLRSSGGALRATRLLGIVRDHDCDRQLDVPSRLRGGELLYREYVAGVDLKYCLPGARRGRRQGSDRGNGSKGGGGGDGGNGGGGGGG
eukprot:6212447-Pleurochrysis_carterae.AAC.1